jgi:hypothetical protein
MFEQRIPIDVARVLAELVDTALADDWNAEQPVMALLWQASAGPDDLRLAVKHLDGSVDDELAPLADEGGYLAVAHSTVTGRTPPELGPHGDGMPVRITVAVDHETDSGVLRHRSGAVEAFGAVDLPVVKTVRSLLCLEPAR